MHSLFYHNPNQKTMKNTIAALLLCFIIALPEKSFCQPIKVELLQTLNCNSKVEYLTYSPDGKKIAAALHNGSICIWNSDNPTEPKLLTGHTDIVNHVEFSRSGNLMASASNDGTVRLWDVSALTELKHWQTALPTSVYKEAYFVTFSADEQFVYFGGKIKKIKRGITTGTDVQLQTIFEGNFDITIGRISPDGKFLAFANGYAISFLNLQTAEVIKTLDSHIPDYINDIRFSNNGKLLSAWCEKGLVLLWDYPYCSFLKTLDAGNNGYSHIAFSNDDAQLISGNVGPAFRIWDISNAKFTEVNQHAGKVNTFACNPTESTVFATGSYDKTIKLWQIGTNVPAPTPPVAQTQPEPQPITEVNNRQVVAKANLTVSSPNITVNIWDDRREDGDVVSLFLNGDCVLEQYTLVNTVKTLKLTLGANRVNTLVLYAHNLGAQPPNTAAISIFDGRQTRRITLSSDFEGSESINIVYNPE